MSDHNKTNNDLNLITLYDKVAQKSNKEVPNYNNFLDYALNIIKDQNLVKTILPMEESFPKTKKEILEFLEKEYFAKKNQSPEISQEQIEKRKILVERFKPVENREKPAETWAERLEQEKSSNKNLNQKTGKTPEKA